MITLSSGQRLYGKSDDTGTGLVCTVFGDMVSTSAHTFTQVYQGTLGTTAAQLVAASNGQQFLIKSIFVANTTAGSLHVAFYTGGSASTNLIVSNLTVPATGSASYEDGVGWTVYNADGLPLQASAVLALIGDVIASGASPLATTVVKINGNPLGATTPTGGNLLIASGTTWISQVVSGDAALSAAGALTLASTAVTAAAYGSATQVPTFTVDAKGRLTAAANVAIAISNTAVSGLGTMSTQNASAVAITGGGATFTADLKLGVAGNGLYIKEGTNATLGTGTLAGGTVTVSTTKVTASSRIILTNTGGGVVANIGTLYLSARVAGTSFTVTSTNALDTSSFNWIIVEPA